MAGCLHSLLPDGQDGSTQKRGMCSVKIASTFGRLESWLPHGARWVMGNSAAPVSVKTETERSSKVCSYGAETMQNERISFETDFRKWLIQPFHKPISTTLWANNHCDPIWYNLSANQGRKWPAAEWRLLKSDTISLVDATLGISCLTALPVKLGEKHFLWASQK